MRTRLQTLLGKDRVGELNMGTFHSLCARFLRKYAHTIGLSDNFSICDADEAKKIMTQLLKKYRELLAKKDMTIREGLVMSKISQAKAKGITHIDFLEEVDRKYRGVSLEDMNPLELQEKITAEVYQEYETLLRKNNALDFDDLLVYGVKMFKEWRAAVAWCQHILVDEFQDTNIIQYDLMRTIAHKGCVTIVGDPDQSIYGWRSAEIENLNKMKRNFPGTCEVLLEENYRSTSAVLRLSLAIIAEDKNRIQKSLHTSHPAGKTPTLRPCSTETNEAAFIAVEIKRLVAYTGGLLQFEDFAILLRFNALSRVIESSLQKEGIPCRILGGHRFFERLEVKDLLAYLQVVDNPDFYPAFIRAVNTPSRGVGEKTLLEIASKAEQCRISHLAFIERIFDGTAPDIKPPAKRKISSFVQTIRALRDLAQKKSSAADIIQQLIKAIDYKEYLKRTQNDWESRWANVQELINFATEVTTDAQNRNAASSETPLRFFLQASSLSSEGDNDGTDTTNNKVTIATCHAAKGLEWPVVMIPSVEEGTFPFARNDDVEEERRLLYVACTRAKGLLFLTHTCRRMIAGQQKDVDRSSFVENVMSKYPGILMYECPRLDAGDRVVLSTILRRNAPDEAEVTRRITEFNEAMRTRENVGIVLEETRGEGSEAVQPAAPVLLNGDTVRVPEPTFKTANRMMLFHALHRQGRHDRNRPENQNSRESSITGEEGSHTCNPIPRAPTINNHLHRIASPTRAPPTSGFPSRLHNGPRLAMQNGSSMHMANDSREPASGSSSSVQHETAIHLMQVGSVTPRSRINVGTRSPVPLGSSQSSNSWQRELQAGMVEPSRLEDTAIGPVETKNTSLPPSPQTTAESSTKRRLGMGRGTSGYANKRFKLPW